MNKILTPVGVAGAGSTIATNFLRLLDSDHFVAHCDRLNELPTGMPRYLICTGYLAGKSIREITNEEADLTWHRNFLDIARFCDLAFAAHPACRICVIGSESGFAGSHDMAYAGAKAALHLYVETKRLETPEQQIVCIAPTVIWDSNMTQSRKDIAALQRRFEATRHGRALTAAEVAVQAYQALFVATPFLSNTSLRLGART